MSTEYRFPDESWACTRWGKRSADIGCSLECGNPDRAMRTAEWLQENPSAHYLTGEDGSRLYWDTADSHFLPDYGFRDYEWTFGEFGGTVEVGTGEYFDRLEDMGTFGRRRSSGREPARTFPKPTSAKREASRGPS